MWTSRRRAPRKMTPRKSTSMTASAADEPEPLDRQRASTSALLATEFLILGVDPYPRKPGVAFERPKPQSDAAGNPFAALAALQKKGTVKE